ncbi:biosynthetic-type acetolactate synthase large subunit [Clostridium grantii]|uniref:Acetolactate synthase n=1 Tax=Clostridium grantii DSM 8605 TaxID=1121316 RepID=A0A1M5T7S5_9CLOT|nr:biosynthetic-type acetolactate synthase large subunit [Clostridium grantii]SHH46781.1 acetolactate synthase, large subunit [Clostridium grantii DSM 8605]
MKLNGAQLFLQCLKELNVDTFFGYPGGSVLPIYDCLYYERELKHILTAHEQGATHAADGYARASGKVGVALTTSGPGATNSVTGIATAFSDSVPIVVITGQVPTALLGRHSFQEMDIRAITKPITKKTFLIDDVNKIAEIFEEAFFLAKEGRPGPILVDFPKDIQLTEVEYEVGTIAKLREARLKNAEVTFDSDFDSLKQAIQLAADAINNCERPMIYAGGGVEKSGGEAALLEFAEKIKSPVTTSLMGLGGFPGTHKYFTGLPGMHGTRSSNLGISKCDVLIAIGCRFSDRVTGKTSVFAEKATIIHIDIDEKELGKNVGVDLPLKGDVKKVLTALIDLVNPRVENKWNEDVQKWKQDFPYKYNDGGVLTGQYVVEELYKVTKGDAIITTEVGQNQIWTAQYYKFNDSKNFISSGGMGTMGYGLPAAVGVSFTTGGKKVINVAGDGSFMMNSHELSTVSRYRIPMLQLIFNNSTLGMVYQWQGLFHGNRYSFTEFGDEVSFEKLAAAYNIPYFKLDKKEEAEKVLKAALEIEGPVIVECIIPCEQNVYPIVPPGESIENMIEE